MEVPSAAHGVIDGAPSSASPLSCADPGALDHLALETDAVVFEGRRTASLCRLDLKPPDSSDVIVDIEWSGVSAGTERLLWSGEMPPFPGMGYPLVPGYESVGKVIWADERRELLGKRVFVPGASCYEAAHGLFGASASRVVADAARLCVVDFEQPETAILLALAATAHHAVADGAPPDLIVGHGILGRLLARLTMALGAPAPNVWEIDPERADADGYAVMAPECDGRTDYRAIYDVSGDVGVIDDLVAAMAPGGEITLAGFYAERPSFSFPQAFMKEMRMRVAAEWKRADMDAVVALVASGALSLDGLITHTRPASHAGDAYATAFEDASCLKMVLDWRRPHGSV